MGQPIKILFSSMMILALCFGYADIYLPMERYDFERLHIFLFNLCTGGTIILYFSENRGHLTLRTGSFLILSLFYALFAFLNIYSMTIILSLILAGIVESIRIEEFSLIPVGFFSPDSKVSARFHQASLLCLSIGLVLSSLVILNNIYLGWVVMEKLTLNTFFLGFSFPLSLITLSVIFSMIREGDFAPAGLLSIICFWIINLGVITFFAFILLEWFPPQIVVTSALFLAVVTVFYLYHRLGQKLQQKEFLSSGMGFLVITAVSGIIYILFQMAPDYDPSKSRWLLKLHTFASLYGWNICGLAVICRYRDFPIRLHSGLVIGVHWLTAIVLAPLGTLFVSSAILAVIGYMFIVLTLFFSRDRGDNPLVISGN